jgi:hypothetical protein
VIYFSKIDEVLIIEQVLKALTVLALKDEFDNNDD